MGRLIEMEVDRFYWFARPEDFDELGNLTVDISGGRSRNRWVPSTLQSAKLFLRRHPDAEGLRKASLEYIPVTIYLLEPIVDLSADYPESIVEGLTGVVIRTPFKGSLPQKPNDRAIERGAIQPQVSYTTSKMIQTYEPKQFGSLEMGLLSKEDILAMSKVEIVSAGAFQDNEAINDQTPILNGVHDLRMGAFTARGDKCRTCDLAYNELQGSDACLGHFGHINLTTPVPKLQFLGLTKYEAIATFPILFALNSTCHSCYRLMIPQRDLDALENRMKNVFDNNKRNFYGHTTIRNRTREQFKLHHGTKPETRANCPHCGEFSPELRFNHGNAEFYVRAPDTRYEGGARAISYEAAYDILENIIEEDVFFLGMDPGVAKPADLFFSQLPVSPNVSRPPRARSGQKIKDLDDMTKLYQDVVQYNETLFERRLKQQNDKAAIKNLYYAVSRIWDNHNLRIGSGGTTQERGYGGSVKNVALKGLKQRLTGKKGRFRNNLQSKYVDEVGYSTITPYADLSIDEVGVPLAMAKKTTVSERVTLKNRARLKAMCLRDIDEHPRVMTIYLDGDKREKHRASDTWNARTGVMTEERADKLLQVGALVQRSVENGDIALFNRAPSLHRQSVLGMRVRVLPINSLAMNPTICIPFNADYDGDAMKVHFVQSEEARAEAKKWMMLDKNIIHARYGKLTVATDQDQTSGLYLLTHTNKRRKDEWNPSTGLGFTSEGIPYFDKRLAVQSYKYVYSEIRDENELLRRYKDYKKVSKDKPVSYQEWYHDNKYRRVETLPSPDYKTPEGNDAYTGRAIFGHLFTVLDCEYVSATFKGNTPAVDDAGNIKRKPDGVGKEKERIIVYKGKLLQGTIEKDSFGEGGSSLAPPFIYHEGYEAGQAKLNEFIEMVTRLGYAGHHVVGYTMGVTDVNIYSKTANDTLNQLYDSYSEKMAAITTSYFDKSYLDFAVTNSDKVMAITAPADFIEEKIVDLATEYEDRILVPIEDEQGSGNPMQIAVRSKARGKDQNVRQMGGSFGMVLVGGKRIVHGINPYRALPHFPKGDPHPKYTGFVKSGYAKGMNPAEFWQTSSAGRRSAVESGQGQIAQSGYLERKMIKALEPLVVNDKKQVVNVRTGRVVSPLVGEDGLAPYHIRGADSDTNSSGYIISTQPLLFKYECKHGYPLESVHAAEYPEHKCTQCSKDTNFSRFEDELSKLDGLVVPKTAQDHIRNKIQGREVSADTLRKMARSLHQFYNESACRTGEAIGATAGGCLGEPATQAALRTFHFAGKMSFQGSVDRLEQLLESPLEREKIRTARTTFGLKEQYNTPRMAEKIGAVCRKVTIDKIVDYIEIDPQQMRLNVLFKDTDKVIRPLQLANSQLTVQKQIEKALDRTNKGYKILTEVFRFNKGLRISILGSQKDLLRAKEAIMQVVVSGITDGELVIVTETNTIDIRNASIGSLNNIVDRLGDYIDFETFQTNNLAWVYEKFGLEAMLTQFVAELDGQMNGAPGEKGVGEYDVRYIRTIADLMGEEGIPMSLGPAATAGLGSSANYSVLSACSTEGVPKAILGGSLMGNYDELNGPAEAIISGAVPAIGDFVPTSE